jgi:hypothetical protein
VNHLQAAYYESCAMQTSNIVRIPEGLHAVVCEAPDYCRSTDAILPNPHRSVVSLHLSRRIAEHIAKRMTAETMAEEDYEARFVVLPKLKEKPFTPQEARGFRAIFGPIDDEIPF